MADRAEGNKIRAAVIGAGWFAAQNHRPALQRLDDVSLDGVCRLAKAELQRVRDHFGFALASEDFRDLLARKPGVVIVASPHYLHYEHARAALEAGAHLLCEKPMTLDPSQAWDLVATAVRTGRLLLLANGYHYLPKLDAARRLILQGGAGRIEHVVCHFASATRPVFRGSVGLRRWQTTFFRPAIETWQDPARGGGFTYGQLCHSIALLLWLTDLRARDVVGRVRGEGGIDLYHAAIVTFDSGMVGVIAGAPSVPEGGQARLRPSVSGTEGILDLDVDLGCCELERHDGGRQTILPAAGEWACNCQGPVNRLIALARGTGAENLSPGSIGARTVELIAAMLRSAASGAAVTLVQ